MVKNAIGTLSLPDATAAVAALTEDEHFQTDGAEVYRGIHPLWGPCVLIFPMAGDPISVPMQGFNLIPAPPIEAEITIIRNADDAIGRTL